MRIADITRPQRRIDKQQANVGVDMPPISLLEELLLLTLDDAGGEFDRVPELQLACGVAGAALMDLALRGRIDSDLTALWVVDATPTGDPVLDKALTLISAAPTREPVRIWMKRLAGQASALRTTAIEQLCARGILRPSEDRFVWGNDGRRYPIVEGQQRPEAKGRILSLLFNAEIPDATDVALTAIADACKVFDRILTPKELVRAAPRIRQIAALDLIGGDITRTAVELGKELKTAERSTVVAGLAGNIMEWFDFGVYGFFAEAVGKLFFPAHDPAVSLLASFGVFAAGFLARPLGGLFFGYIGDSRGRRTAVMASVVMMVIPTLLMALLPTYDQIGIVAPLLLILLRLMQGLAVGGEYTTSIVMLVESAQPSRRGRVGSFAPFGAIAGMLLGSGVGATLLATLSPEHAAAWGWRLAFLTGLLIGIVVYIVRRRLPPDETITALEGARKAPIRKVFRTQWRAMLQVIGLNTGHAVGFYLCFVYLPTWLKREHHLPSATALLLTSAALTVLLTSTLIAGALCDRIGRKPLMLTSFALLSVLTVPLFHLMIDGDAGRVLIAEALFAVMLAGVVGSSAALMVEAFPKHVRCSGLSVGYNLAQTAFGGTVPLVAVYLVAHSGNPVAPAYYLTAACILSFVTLAFMRQQPAP
jgi:MHS family proline/betaine transporter-like MFS transporter